LNSKDLTNFPSTGSYYISVAKTELKLSHQFPQYWELHEDEKGGDYVKMFAWKPSSPSWEKKHEYLKAGKPVWDLYDVGQNQEVFPKVCKEKGR
jgi:hypothetical protein